MMRMSSWAAASETPARHNLVFAAVARGVGGIDANGHVEIGALRGEGESGRHDSDHFASLAAQQDVVSNNVHALSEGALP
jgi:hypothetical protein